MRASAARISIGARPLLFLVRRKLRRPSEDDSSTSIDAHTNTTPRACADAPPRWRLQDANPRFLGRAAAPPDLIHHRLDGTGVGRLSPQCIITTYHPARPPHIPTITTAHKPSMADEETTTPAVEAPVGEEQEEEEVCACFWNEWSSLRQELQ